MVTTNVKVTDLGSKEADEDEVWKLKFGEDKGGRDVERLYTYASSVKTNDPFRPCVGRSLNIETTSGRKAASRTMLACVLAQPCRGIYLLQGCQTKRGASSGAA